MKIKPDLLKLILFAALVALVATNSGYFWGRSNQIEQLPEVLRAIDPNYLPNDFFTNASTAFGPRYFFDQLIAFLTNFIELKYVYYILALISNVGVSIVSALFAKDIFKGSIKAGYITAVSVMTVSTFALGWAEGFSGSALVPGGLIMPLLLASIWLAKKRRPVLVGLICGVASIIHVLMGLELGAILLAALLILELYRLKTSGHADLKFIGKIVMGFCLMMGLGLITLLPYYDQPKIDPETFIYILAYLRHPHHYLPTAFPLEDYLLAFVFFASMFFVSRWTQKLDEDFRHLLYATSLVIAATLIAGYIFVEVIPSRLITSAQTFRNPFVLKWLGLILFSGYAAELLPDKGEGQTRNNAVPILAGMMTPFTLGIGVLSNGLQRVSIRRNAVSLRAFIEAGSLLFLILAISAGGFPNLLFPFFLFIALALIYLPGVFVIPAIAALILVGVFQVDLPLPRSIETYIYKGFHPNLALGTTQLGEKELDIIEATKQYVPEDAIVLTPPDFGFIRFLANRAIVVDYEAFPFQDTAMLEWQERIKAAYGLPDVGGYPGFLLMAGNYYKISDNRILSVGENYGATYAILFTQNETSYPVVYRNLTYQIIQILH